MFPIQHLYIQYLLYKEVFTLFTTKTVPVVYSTETSLDGDLYEIGERIIKVLNGWRDSKIFSREKDLISYKFYVNFINQL